MPQLSSKEDQLIQALQRGLFRGPGVIRGIGDDCAVLSRDAKTHQLLASDMLVEGVHFTRSTPPEKIGWKSMAVNLSDVAAMGGVPQFAVVSVGLPRSANADYLKRLYRGLNRCGSRYGVTIVGGDMVRSQRKVIDLSILGFVEKGRLTTRSGAKAGDHLLVTGRLGGAVRSGKHLNFTPRLKEAQALVGREKIHAMMDLSDGLLLDLGRLCRASRVCAEIQLDQLPRARSASIKSALTEGEDFELLVAAAPAQTKRLLSWSRRGLPCGLHLIGRVLPRRRKEIICLINGSGQSVPLPGAGFRHF